MRSRSLLFAGAFLFALAALMPLRLALGWFGLAEGGLAARAASGTVWNGMLRDARLGPLSLGDVRARLHLLPLFLGRARLSLAGEGFRGAVSASRHGFAVDDFSGRFRPGVGFAPLPVTSLEAEDLSAGFASGRCVRAAGRVRAAITGAEGTATALVGPVRCAGDALLLSLADAAAAARLDVRLLADGRYRADFLVRPGDPATAARLAAAGFRPVAGGHLLRLEGAF